MESYKRGCPNITTGPHPQVKMQCRKGIPSALRARCWPLLCGAQMCRNNNPGTYQVKKLAVPALSFPPLSELLATLSPHIHLPTTHRSWQRPLETRSGWRPLAGTCTASSLCMRCLCHPRDTGMGREYPLTPSPHARCFSQFPSPELHP